MLLDLYGGHIKLYDMIWISAFKGMDGAMGGRHDRERLCLSANISKGDGKVWGTFNDE
jgi:hypothetical protein